MRFSVTANEKVDAQIIYARGEKVPTADPQRLQVGDDLQPITGLETLNGLVLRSARFNILYRPIFPAHSLLSMERFDYHRISI